MAMGSYIPLPLDFPKPADRVWAAEVLSKSRELNHKITFEECKGQYFLNT